MPTGTLAQSQSVCSSEEIKVHGWSGAILRVASGPARVETLPAGFEGSPVPRNLVRNVFQPTWNMRDALSNSELLSFKEIRPLNIPEGAKPERLRVVGWVQDAVGRVSIAAESICLSEEAE